MKPSFCPVSSIHAHPRGPLLCREAGAPEIREITTLEQLEGLEPLRVAGGWEVRLGLASQGQRPGRGGCSIAMPGTRAMARRRNSPLTATSMGSSSAPSSSRSMRRRTRWARWQGSGRCPPRDSTCALILTAWEGARTVRVVSGAGKVIARKALRGREARHLLLQFLATWRKERQAGLPGWAALAKAYAGASRFRWADAALAAG